MGLLWPLDYNKAWTLGEVTELRGIGLHCGEELFNAPHSGGAISGPSLPKNYPTI